MPKRIRRAKLIADAVTVICPHCGNHLTSPCGNGSLMWTVEDFPEESCIHECDACGSDVLVSVRATITIY